MFLSIPLLFVLSLVALAFSPVTFFVRLDYYTLGIIETLSFVVICPQRLYCLKKNTDFFFALLWGLTVNQEQRMYVILKLGQIFWTSFLERFVSFFNLVSVVSSSHLSSFLWFCIILHWSVFLCINTKR